MIADLVTWLSGIAHSLIATFGYPGIIFGMAIESFNIPLPSEAIMTFAGVLVAQGELNFWWVVLAGALGNLIGSIGNYYLGAYGGRPLLEKYGKYVLVSQRDLDRADHWFAKYGLAAVFFTRMVPVIRTFISLPAGMARVPIVPFIIFTFAGSLLWSMLLTYLGMLLGANYEAVIKPWMQRFEIVIMLGLVALVGLYVWHHLRKPKRRRKKADR